jgi:hypothetical protein
MLHAAIPLWILVAIALWCASRPWRERRRKAHEMRRAHAMLYPSLYPQRRSPSQRRRCYQQTLRRSPKQLGSWSAAAYSCSV